MGARYFALIIGVVYTLFGVLGFIPNFVAASTNAPKILINAGYGYLLGLFPVNILLNFVHLVICTIKLSANTSFVNDRASERSLVLLCGLLAVMGLFPVLNTTFGLMPIFGHDIWLHALTAVIAFYFGSQALLEPAKIQAEEQMESTER